MLSSHPDCSAFLVRGLSPSHLVVMETRAAAGTALAWALYVGPIEHGTLKRASSAGQTIVSISLGTLPRMRSASALGRHCIEWIASQIYIEVKTQKVLQIMRI